MPSHVGPSATSDGWVLESEPTVAPESCRPAECRHGAAAPSWPAFGHAAWSPPGHSSKRCRLADVQPGGPSRTGCGGPLADATPGEEPCHLPHDQALAPKQHVAAVVDRQQLRPGDPLCGTRRILEGRQAVVPGIDDQRGYAELLQRVALHVGVGNVLVEQQAVFARCEREQALLALQNPGPLFGGRTKAL